jgi:hypothetical protein
MMNEEAIRWLDCQGRTGEWTKWRIDYFSPLRAGEHVNSRAVEEDSPAGVAAGNNQG